MKTPLCCNLVKKTWKLFSKNISFLCFQESELIARLEERLALVTDGARRGLRSDVICDICHTPVTRLKQEAIAMVQSLERAQADSPIPATHIPTYLGGSKSVAARSMPRTTPHYSSTHHRYVQTRSKWNLHVYLWRIWLQYDLLLKKFNSPANNHISILSVPF